MRRRTALTIIAVILASPLAAESIRGPVVAVLEVDPAGEPMFFDLGLDEIVLAGTAGDTRFFDAIEIAVPAAVTEIPGALSLLILTTGTISERAGVAEINGAVALSRPLTRAGNLIVQIPLHPQSEASASSAVTVLDQPLSADDLPLAVTVHSLMKGTPKEIADAVIPIVVRPIGRNVGAVDVLFRLENGSLFQVDSLLAPEFELKIDGATVDVQSEYLLDTGLHHLSLTSDRYQDQDMTIGIEQAQIVQLTVPILPSLARISYTAPRGSRVYVDGSALDEAVGDFTAPPGEHTIVVVVGDYTVTRRFSVVEGRDYNLSITMDVVIEEAK